MPRALFSLASFVLLGSVVACQSKPEKPPVLAAPAVVPLAAPPAQQPMQPEAKLSPAGSIVGTYRQATDSTDCDCDLAITIWRAGHQLRYRIEDYPEKGLVTADSADGRRGLDFVSTPKPHKEAHEWSGSLEGDTLLVQTYGNSMNEYENFVGGCGCKFLTLVKQR